MRIFLAAITDSFALGFCENLSSAPEVFQKLFHIIRVFWYGNFGGPEQKEWPHSLIQLTIIL
jgi:hypothetical protein